ncbi:hypothetical protein ILYODFUR_006935 [Ilyodon furcidens]|uniref:Uncharacterized protein n=1 Tax=Ilyodon furcidens TaxID=33524 RepID=A0ABV0U764_9TELE
MDHVERMVLKGLKAELAPMESLDPLAQQERKVNLGSQACQVIPEDKDLRARADSLDSLEQTARKEQGALLVNLVLEDKEVQRVLGVLEEPEVQQENPVPRAQQATTAPLARPAREDLKGLRDQWASLDQRALLDHLERTGFPDTLDSVERRDSKEKLAHQDQEVLLGLRDPLERLVLLVREGIPDPQAHLESRVFQALLARREPRVILDHKAPLVKTVPQAFVGSLEREVYPVLRAHLV